MNESSPPKPAFIDSNIWLYALIQGQDTTKEAHANTLIQTIPVIAISSQVINEVAVNLIKKAAFTEEEIRTLVNSFYQLYTVVPLIQDTLLSASRLREHYRISYWDSLIIASGLTCGASIIYSEDMHHGLIIDASVTIVNPFR